MSFANCGLPFYLSGEISNHADLVVQTPEELQQRFNLDVRPNHEVTKILPDSHEVIVRYAGQLTHESYDRLILAPGAQPIMPDLPGVTDAKNVYALRSIPDLDRIMTGLQAESTQHVLVVGGGFIGLEVAENLVLSGLVVTVVEQAPHVLPPLDTEMAAFVQTELMRNGVRVITGQAVASFEDAGKVAILADGTRLTTDLTIMAVGVRPASQLAKDAGLQLGLHDGILVDSQYQTSEADIYAVGDAIVVEQQVTDEPALIPLASPANRQGRQVADNLANLMHLDQGSLGTAIVRAFKLTAAATGLSEYQAQQAGLTCRVVHVRGGSHASYFPGSTPLTLKLVFNPDSGEIYGAQGVGEQGVDKRIDVLATAIKGGMGIDDLPELELTYAPPFGSAKDPVNMLGYVAMNIAEGLSKTIQWYQLPAALAAGRQVLDVRDVDELADGEFKQAHNIPLNQLRQRLTELDPAQPYVVSCFSGQRSYIAERILRQHGFDVVNLDGAFALYHAVRPQDLVYQR